MIMWMGKQTIMAFAGLICASCILAGCSSSSGGSSGDTAQEEAETQEGVEGQDGTKADASDQAYEYDELQSLFTEITLDTTEQELESAAAGKGLFYTTQAYSTEDEETFIYNLAFTEGAAKQENAEPGDHLEVWYEKETGAMMLARYFKAESADYTGLLYGFGTWYDFRDIDAQDYAGYYIIDSYGKNKGITIKHTDGEESRSNYFACGSAGEVMDKVIGFFEE